MTRAAIAAALIALAMPAIAQNVPAFKSDSDICSCTGSVCNNACIRKADPEVIAALRKRFPDLDESTEAIGVLFDGAGGWDVIFWTPNAHRACRVTLKPVKLSNCRQVHG